MRRIGFCGRWEDAPTRQSCVSASEGCGGNPGYLSSYHAYQRVPGECQEDHEELYNFVDELEFDRLGVFTIPRKKERLPRRWKTRCPRR